VKEESNMSNEIVKKAMSSSALTSMDGGGFNGWNDDTENSDDDRGGGGGGGIIQGTLIKFTNEAKWVTRDGDELPKNLGLVAVSVVRVVQKWTPDREPDGPPLILEPNQKFPNIEEMNNKAPREEWGEGPDGKPCGPYQGQHVLYLLDLETMDKYTYPTSTVGGRIAIRDLRDKLCFMRKLRGPDVYPVVTLSDTFFPTRFGGRQRPHFVIKQPGGWVRLGGGGEGGEVQAVTPPSSPATPQQALDQFAKPAAKPAPQTDLPLTTVETPTLGEEMNDALPSFDAPAAAKLEIASEPKAPAPRPTARRDLKKSSAKNSTARSATRKRLTNLDAG
jgi:hypothetical protein